MDSIYNTRYSVTFCNIVGHVQIVIFTLLLLSKEIVKILYNEKIDSIWEWHILATFVYLHNCCYYKKKYILIVEIRYKNWYYSRYNSRYYSRYNNIIVDIIVDIL